MPSATNVQNATLVFAAISAVGSLVAGFAGYRQMSRTTRSPRLTLGWNEDEVLVSLRNAASTPRTAYSIGLQYTLSPLGHRAYASIADPLPYSVDGRALPALLQPGERLQWRLPYGLLKVKYAQTSPMRILGFRIVAELGEDRYAKRPRRAIRKRIAAATLSRDQALPVTFDEEGPT